MSDIRQSVRTAMHRNLSSNVAHGTKVHNSYILKMERLNKEIADSILAMKESRNVRVHASDISSEKSNLSALANKVSTLKSIVDKLHNILTKQCSSECQPHFNASFADMDNAILTGNPSNSNSGNWDIGIPGSQNTRQNSNGAISITAGNISKTKEVSLDFKSKFSKKFYDNSVDMFRCQNESLWDALPPNSNNDSFISGSPNGSTRGFDFLSHSSSNSINITVQGARYGDQSLRLASKSDEKRCRGTGRNAVGQRSMEFKPKKKLKGKCTPENSDNRMAFLLDARSRQSSLSEEDVNRYSDTSLLRSHQEQEHRHTVYDSEVHPIKSRAERKFKSKSTMLNHDNRMTFLKEEGDNQMSLKSGHPSRLRNSTSERQQSSSQTEGKGMQQNKSVTSGRTERNVEHNLSMINGLLKMTGTYPGARNNVNNLKMMTIVQESGGHEISSVGERESYVIMGNKCLNTRWSTKSARHYNQSGKVAYRAKVDDKDISEAERLSREGTDSILTLKDSCDVRVHADDFSSENTALFTSVVDVVNDVRRLFHELAAIPTYYTENQCESKLNNNSFHSDLSRGSTRDFDFLAHSSNNSRKITVHGARYSDKSLRFVPESGEKGCHGTDRNAVGKWSMEFKPKKRFKCKCTKINDDNRMTFLLGDDSSSLSSLNEDVYRYDDDSLGRSHQEDEHRHSVHNGGVKVHKIKSKAKKQFKSKLTMLNHDNRMQFLKEELSSKNEHCSRNSINE